jgi:hypothetical protein
VEWEKAVTQLRDIYEGMTDYQKQFVPDETLVTLNKYEERMKELVAQAEENKITEV